MKTVQDIMKEKNAEHNIEMFRQLQQMDHEHKVYHAEEVIENFLADARDAELNTHISVGGLDSITLMYFMRSLGHDIPCISRSSLEDKSIQAVHKAEGVICLPPATRPDGKQWTKVAIIREFGFPVLSKEIAAKIELLQNPTEKNKTVRHAIITGETGEYGGYQKDSRMKMADRWLELFGGYENEAENVCYQCPNFKVSSRCCYYLKEKPCDDWAKEHNSVPFLGLMASEGGRRAKSLMLNGCNYWGKSTIRSAPFAIFDRQDLLQLALDLNVPVPEIYGEIVRDPDGTLRTTKAKRTGCSMCGFGIHMEGRPHRFDLLRETNPKEWDFWMRRCVTDETGTYGWGRVLDYIGVGWENEPDTDLVGQYSLFGGEDG